MEKQFIEVVATPCNSQGIKAGMGIPVEFSLSSSLVKAIRNNEIYVGGNEVLHIGGNYYKDIRLKK